MSIMNRSLLALTLAAVLGGTTLVSEPTPTEAATTKLQCLTTKVNGFGEGTGVAGQGTKRAKARAIASWQANARRLGSKYGNWSLAGSRSLDCKRNILKAECVATGFPCRKR